MKFKKLLEGRSLLYKKSFNELITYFLEKANNDKNKAYELVNKYLLIAILKYDEKDLEIIYKVKKYFESNVNKNEIDPLKILLDKNKNKTLIKKENLKGNITNIHLNILNNFADKYNIESNFEDIKNDLISDYSSTKLKKYFTLEKLKEISDKLFKNSELRINIDLDSHEEIQEDLLKNGRLKNQFESESSGGTYAPYKNNSRDNWEQYLFDDEFSKNKEYKKIEYLGKFTKEVAEERPIYGFLKSKSSVQFNKDIDFYNFYINNYYGRCTLLLDDNIKDRCTFTLSNSSNLLSEDYSNRNKKYRTRGSIKYGNSALVYNLIKNVIIKLGNDEDIIKYFESDNLEPILRPYEIYNEIQILGGVDLKRDVKGIILPENIDEDNYNKVLEISKKYNIILYKKDKNEKNFYKKV